MSRSKKTDAKAFRTVADNRKARFNYEIFDKYEAGIELTGTEVKSLRNGKSNIKDSYTYALPADKSHKELLPTTYYGKAIVCVSVNAYC